MNEIYLPIDNVSDFACYSVVDKDTIRAYYTTPSNNSSSNYIDFYINSHYLEKTGTQSWSNYSTLPTCLASNSITTEWYYRNDLSDILISLFIIFILVILLPWLIFRRLFGRWLKC